MTAVNLLGLPLFKLFGGVHADDPVSPVHPTRGHDGHFTRCHPSRGMKVHQVKCHPSHARISHTPLTQFGQDWSCTDAGLHAWRVPRRFADGVFPRHGARVMSQAADSPPCANLTDATIRPAMKLWCANETRAKATKMCGTAASWDISKVPATPLPARTAVCEH